jgi:hypothetical protein
VGFYIGMANYLSLRTLRIAALGLTTVLTLMNTKALLASASTTLRSSQFDLGIMGETIAFIKSTPKDEVWAYTDCGQFAFWSERRFVNLDGLINSRDYQDHLRDGELQTYLRERGVHYLVAGIWDRKQVEDRIYDLMYEYRMAPQVYTGNYNYLAFYLYSYLYNAYSDTLLLPKTAEIWRSSAYVDGNACERLVVYDLDKAGKIQVPGKSCR